MRNLVLLFGDQLDHHSPVFENFDSRLDEIWMAEADEEFTRMWVHYHQLEPGRPRDKGKSLEEILTRDLHELEPEKLTCVQPGEFRLLDMVNKLAKKNNLDLEIKEDNHFFYSINQFKEFANGKKNLLLETFYRQLRKEFGILMDGKQPMGKKWNFDKQNRDSFGREDPGKIKSPRSFTTDKITSGAIDLVNQLYAAHPGNLDHFDLPVNRDEALALSRDFINHRLEHFGQYQDAMWTGKPFLYHSRLSAALNVKLISPKELVSKVIESSFKGEIPFNSIEAFVRQVLGWREFTRGFYWTREPGYVDSNFFNALEPLPSFYWDANTKMQCVKDSILNVINHGYSHHIQRLMVLGLFCLLLGVDPKKFHEWHLAMYNDAIDWVSLPNVLGMSQYADGGLMTSKPYTASGNYINKMSNYCKHCEYRYRESSGNKACPFSTLYYEFLYRNQDKLDDINRMNFQMKNLNRKNRREMENILERGRFLRENINNI